MPIEQKNIENNNIGGKEPKIFVMPEKFLGVLPGEKAPDETVKKISKVSVPPPAPPIPKKATLVAKKKKFPVIPVAGGGILLVIAAGISLYFFVLKPKQAARVVIPATKSIPTLPSISDEATSTKFVEEESATTTPAVVEESVSKGLDSDGDGLTDVEEEVYGSVVSNQDTDLDSFWMVTKCFIYTIQRVQRQKN